MKRIMISCIALMALTQCTRSIPKYSFSYAELRATHPSGLKVMVVPDTNTELVQVDVRYSVGSADDPEGKAGLAHLVEHMMFQLRPDGPKSAPLFQFLPQLATFFNAFTNWDSTHYMTQGIKANLDTFMKMEAMRLFYRCEDANIPASEFEREREVVRNEIRLRTGEAEGQIPQIIMSSVYPKNHPYEQMIGGNDAQLSNITFNDVCDFWNKYYVPSNATLIVAGNVTTEEVTALLDKYYKKIPNRPVGAKRTIPRVKLSRKKHEHELATERSSLHAVWALPPTNTKEGKAVQQGMFAVFSMVAQLAEKWDFAYNISPGVLGGQLQPMFVISVELKKDSDRGKAEEFIWKAVEEAPKLFGGPMLAESKARSKGQFVAGLESLPDRTVRLGELTQFDSEIKWDSEEPYLIKEMKQIDAFDGDYMKSVVKRNFQKKNANLVFVKATAGGKKGDSRSKLKFKTKTHESKGALDVDPAEAYQKLSGIPATLDDNAGVLTYQLKNGMKVILKPYDTLPIVSSQLVFNVGSAHESPKKAGLASSAARFLRPVMSLGGSPMDQVGIRWSGGAGTDTTTFSAQGLNLYLDVMVKGMERLITAGEYDQRTVESWRKRVSNSYKSKRYRANTEMRKQMRLALLGDHPYATTGNTTKGTAGRIDRDALTSFKRKHYTASNATLVITGNFKPEQAKSIINATFGSWSKGHTDKAVSPKRSATSGARYIGVVGPEGPNITFSMGYPAVSGIDKNYAARRVLAGILGERVKVVREKLGASYGIGGGWRPSVGPSNYMIGGPIDSKRAGESLIAIRKGFDEMRQGVGLDEDFVRVRRTLIQRLLGQSTVTADVAGRLSFLSKYGLANDYYSKLMEETSALQPSAVQDLIQTELDPSREVIVLMGGREALENAFKTAGITAVKYVDPE